MSSPAVFHRSIHLAAAIKAGRLLLTEIDESIRWKSTFALESTLSGKTYVRTLQRALAAGYDMELHYLWLSSPEQAIARVRQRVRMGGYSVPSPDIRRRFKRSLANLFKGYLPLATRWAIWDSRNLPAKYLATSSATDVASVRQRIGL